MSLLINMNILNIITVTIIQPYLIVESVSFVLLRDVSHINPKKTIEIINLRMYLRLSHLGTSKKTDSIIN